MGKDEFLELLREKGLEAENEKGCIMVFSDTKKTWKTLRKIAEKVKYQGSYGWRKIQIEAVKKNGL